MSAALTYVLLQIRDDCVINVHLAGELSRQLKIFADIYICIYICINLCNLSVLVANEKYIFKRRYKFC